MCMCIAMIMLIISSGSMLLIIVVLVVYMQCVLSVQFALFMLFNACNVVPLYAH